MAPKAIIAILLTFLITWLSQFEAKPGSLYGSMAHPSYFEDLEDEEGSLLGDFESTLAEDGTVIIDVDDYGAKGGGADDTQAFEQAWEAACSSPSAASLKVPNNNTYLLKPVAFKGPCKSKVSVMIEGTIEAPSDTAEWEGKNQRLWILFSHVENLKVGGGGTVNGNGQVWWKKSCKIDKSQPCKDAPTALTFRSCTDLTVENLNLKDSQQIHIKFEDCNSVTASSLTIQAPSNSPNTDGIHVTETQNIQISNCVIGTGDDCISIVNGSMGVNAYNISCGPGHGISIGSLGEKKSVAQVSDVVVDTAKLHGTTNGVRIKTWQGGRGYAKNIIFQNIDMDDVKNPIIIDQNYCDKKKKCKQEASAVEISNVVYRNIKGTSTSMIAVKLKCSKSIPCKDIVFEDINLSAADEEDEAESLCQNVKWSKKGIVIPSPCNLVPISQQSGFAYYM